MKAKNNIAVLTFDSLLYLGLSELLGRHFNFMQIAQSSFGAVWKTINESNIEFLLIDFRSVNFKNN